MQIERTATRRLRVEVDLPRLAHGVRLDEMAFVVHVEAVVDSMILQIGDESGDIDDGQELLSSE